MAHSLLFSVEEELLPDVCGVSQERQCAQQPLPGSAGPGLMCSSLCMGCKSETL